MPQSLLHKSADEIEASDIDRLIKGSVSEGRYIEYKRELPSNSDTDKKKLLAAVASFANTNGGTIVYGVDAPKGVPNPNMVGLDKLSDDAIADWDAEILRLNHIILSGLDPRIPAVDLRRITFDDGDSALVIRVNQSWIRPHIISFKDWCRFYARSSAGRYLMDIDEIRAAFLDAASVLEGIREFREERLSAFKSDEPPLEVNLGPKLLVHFVPFGALRPGQLVDLTPLNDSPPITLSESNSSAHPNLDGFISYRETRGEVRSYVQVFRNGIVEMGDRYAFALGEMLEREYVNAALLESRIVKATIRALHVLEGLGVAPPVLAAAALQDAKGYSVSSRVSGADGPATIPRQTADFGSVVFENLDETVPTILRPLLDNIYRSGGFPGSPSFDEHGHWTDPWHE